LKRLSISQEDFNHALLSVRPSSTKEFTNQIPKISWKDIGGLDNVKQAIQETIAWPITRPDLFTEMGITPPKGILLYGPPGTGKTLLAKAISNQIKANFLSIKGPELLTKWFAESPRMIRDLFKRAKQLAPCIIFFDEIDALAPQRSAGTGAGGSQERDRVINQFLATLDGMDPISGVFVIGATNRPEAIDPALLRPGRIDRLIYVTVPNAKERLQIFKVHTSKMKLALDVNLTELAEKTTNFTGADIQNICREAVFTSLRKDFASRITNRDHFNQALLICRPSVSNELKEKYDTLSKEIRKKKITEYIQYQAEYR
jgi:transitional endoplasmic reticulum ATPase